MRAAGARLRTLPAAALVASGCSLTPVPGCDQLHTQEFFAWADTPRVTSCLRQGADVTAHDPDGNTAIVAALLDAGAEVNPTDRFGRTPLDRARHPDIIALLLEAGGVCARSDVCEESPGASMR